MIDLDVIEAEIDNTIRHYGGVTLMQCSYVKGLITRLRQAEKDSARYRELRDAESETCLEFINAKARMASPEWLDGMVDEYMQCK